MTWQALWLVLLFGGIVVFLAGGIVRMLQKRWRGLPHFVYNEVGSVTAYCSVTDLKRGIPAYGRVLVLDTIACSASRPPHHHDRVIATSDAFRFYDAVHERSLFVPFASERFMSYTMQAETFSKPPEDLYAFDTAKKKANYAADPRLWFREWANTNDEAIFGARLVAVLAIVVGTLGTMFWREHRDIKARLQAPAVYYTTMAGSSEVYGTLGIWKDIRKLPMVYPDDRAGLDITTGPITDTMPIGGGLHYLCVMRQSNNYRTCGFAADSLGLHLGDIGYLREGKAKRWIAPADYDIASSIHWVITEPEAQALLGKGYRLEK